MFDIPKSARHDENCFQILVTPELATEWLRHNLLNRPMNKRSVQNLVRLMKTGQWRNLWQPIILGQNVVLDGQHRLYAIIFSGVPTMMCVVFNQDEGTFLNIDSGFSRTKLDMIRLGLQDHTIKQKHLSVLKAMLAGASCDHLNQLASIELVEPYKKHRTAIEFAISTLGKGCDNTVLGIMARAYYFLPEETLLSFAKA